MSRQPRMMVFIPLSRDQARGIRSAGRSDDEFAGFAATGQMIAAHGYRPQEREDADYAAQLYASIAGLVRDDDAGRGGRLVVAADVPLGRVRDGRADADYGAVLVSGLAWRDVAAVFVDEPEASNAVRAARTAAAAAADRSLPALLELPEIVALNDEHELLWHIPEEEW